MAKKTDKPCSGHREPPERAQAAGGNATLNGRPESSVMVPYDVKHLPPLFSQVSKNTCSRTDPFRTVHPPGCANQAVNAENKEEGTRGGGRPIRQGHLPMRLVLQQNEISAPPASILEVYRNALPGLGQKSRPTPCSQGCVLEQRAFTVVRAGPARVPRSGEGLKNLQSPGSSSGQPEGTTAR